MQPTLAPHRLASTGALVFSLGIAFTCFQSRPVDAARRRPLPEIGGAYFGSFNGDNGDFWPADFNVTMQSRSRIGGSLQVGGRYRDIYFKGTLRPANGAYALQLTGRGGAGRQDLRITIRATYSPPSADDPAQVGTISGAYTARGQVRERGTFTVRGGIQRNR